MEVREWALGVAGGPARRSSLCIVTKRAGESQFSRAAGALLICKTWFSSAQQKRRKPRRLPPRVVWIFGKNGRVQPIGALFESAVPLDVLRIVPL